MNVDISPQAVSRIPSLGCSLFGALLGLVMVPGGFYLAYHGEMRLVNHGKVFERVAMVPVDQAKAMGSGTVKLRGKPEGEFSTIERYDQPVVYYNLRVEEYEREQDSDGDVSYEWETKNSRTHFVPFAIDGIEVAPEKAQVVGAKQVFQGIRPAGRPYADYDPKWGETHSPEVGDQRLTVSVIPADQELIIFGDLEGGTIAGGSTFVISALDEAATTQHLKTQYVILYWLMKGGATLLIGLGIMALFGPLMSLLGWLPVVGPGLRAGIAFLSLAFGAVSVLLVTALLKYFWVVMAALAVFVLLVLAAIGVTASRRRLGKTVG